MATEVEETETQYTTPLLDRIRQIVRETATVSKRLREWIEADLYEYPATSEEEQDDRYQPLASYLDVQIKRIARICLGEEE